MFSYEDTDVKIIIYFKYVQNVTRHTKIICKKKNTDTYFILILYIPKSVTVNIFRETGMGHILIHINKLADCKSQVHIATVMVLHASTGTDSTSSIKWKKRPIKLLSHK